MPPDAKFQDVAQALLNHIRHFPSKDHLLFNSSILSISQDNFQEIPPLFDQTSEKKTIAFIDGGQAEIMAAGNLSVSFIRAVALVFKGMQKIQVVKREFFLLSSALYTSGDIFYQGKIFGDKIFGEKIIEEQDLFVSSHDSSLQQGWERASISKLANMARRFSELALASEVPADIVVLDGTLDPGFTNEEKYLPQRNAQQKTTPLSDVAHGIPQEKIIGALAKSSSLFTSSGNSPVVLLNKLRQGVWQYHVNAATCFVKLHAAANHVFRFVGNRGALLYLVEHSQDAAFLGYPYGLILADRLARVSNEERTSLRLKLLLDQENKEIRDYLQTSNAHDILDSLG